MAARALFQPLPVSLFVHLQRQPDRLGRLARRQVHLRRRDRRGRWRLLRAVLAPSRLCDVLVRAPLFIVMDAGTFLHIFSECEAFTPHRVRYNLRCEV